MIQSAVTMLRKNTKKVQQTKMLQQWLQLDIVNGLTHIAQCLENHISLHCRRTFAHSEIWNKSPLFF